VLRTIVEGEPGIFPDPVARVMRTIGGRFDRRKAGGPAADDRPGTTGADPQPDDGGDTGDEGHSGESR